MAQHDGNSSATSTLPLMLRPEAEFFFPFTMEFDGPRENVHFLLS
jgi:hypothetical protein